MRAGRGWGALSKAQSRGEAAWCGWGHGEVPCEMGLARGPGGAGRIRKGLVKVRGVPFLVLPFTECVAGKGQGLSEIVFGRRIRTVTGR